MSWFDKFLCKVFHINCPQNPTPTPTPTPPPTPPPVPADLLFGYFYTAPAAETADHVNVIMINDGGPASAWDIIMQRMIDDMQAAVAAGINRFVLSIGIFLWDQTPNPPYLDRCRLRPTAYGDLAAWRAQLDSLGLLDKVVALYPIDEPELHDLDNAYLTPVLNDIRAIWPGPKLGVIYGDSRHYPGITSYDWVGIDDYGAGAGVLNELPMISPAQRYILVPGGGNPWRQDPQPFYNYALNHANVVWICPFLWITADGIGANGMAPAYRAVGTPIKGANP